MYVADRCRLAVENGEGLALDGHFMLLSHALKLPSEGQLPSSLPGRSCTCCTIADLPALVPNIKDNAIWSLGFKLQASARSGHVASSAGLILQTSQTLY